MQTIPYKKENMKETNMRRILNQKENMKKTNMRANKARPLLYLHSVSSVPL